MPTGSRSNYLEYSIAKEFFHRTTYTFPLTAWIGLWLSAVDDTYSGVSPGEVTGVGYGRYQVVMSTANWSTANSGQWHNATAFSFQTASGNWGNVSAAILLDSANSGNALYHLPLAAMKNIQSGDSFMFASGAITILED